MTSPADPNQPSSGSTPPPGYTSPPQFVKPGVAPSNPGVAQAPSTGGPVFAQGPVGSGDFNPNAHDVFHLRQQWTLVINRYFFSLPAADGTDGQPIAFVEQKRFKFKEDIRFYTDETKAQEILAIKARQRFDPAASYDITDGAGHKIGAIQKQFGKSLLRSSYLLFDAHGQQVCEATERSLAVALFRRVVGFIPFVEYVADWIPIPYDFVFKRGDDVLVTHTRKRWQLIDHYTIDASGDPGRTLDRRLVLAAAVGMDALQAR